MSIMFVKAMRGEIGMSYKDCLDCEHSRVDDLFPEGGGLRCTKQNDLLTPTGYLRFSQAESCKFYEEDPYEL